MNERQQHLEALLAAIVALVISLCALLGVSIDLNGSPAPKTVTTQAVGPGGHAVAVKAPASAVAQEKRGLEDHAGLRDEAPQGASVDDLAKLGRQEQRIRQTQKPLPTAGAVQSVPGCTTRFVVNQSSRNGIRPRLFVLHYTVGYNRAGWSDVWAVVSLFNRPSFQASSNFVIDAEGHCAYIVPIERKAWTQAGGNSVSVSVEVIDYGNETRYMDPAGYRKLGSVIRTVHVRAGIPVRIGSVAGCGVGRAGIVDHFQGGNCWGGHHDIRPFPFTLEVHRILGAAVSAPTATLVKPERLIASRRCYHWRKRAAARRGSATFNVQLRYSRLWKRRAGARKTLLTRLDHYSVRHRGVRRKLMARTERMNRADRRAVCR